MYPCVKCGACCRNVGNHPIYADLCDEQGKCVYWDAVTGLCKIYDSRPLKCKVDDAYEAFFKDSLSKDDYYGLNLKACEMLRFIEETNEDAEHG